MEEKQRLQKLFIFTYIVKNVLTTENYGIGKRKFFQLNSDLRSWKETWIKYCYHGAVGCGLRNITGPRFKQILLKSQGF